eukprot:46241-Eustigmatos_ZCMA.PRE.1
MYLSLFARRKRRAKLMERNRAERKEVSLLFVESICDDEDTLQRNYALKLQNNGEVQAGAPSHSCW